MLDAIRKRSGSIVVKVLLVFLVISFGAWGIGDYVTGRGFDRVVATVGDREISSIEFENRYRNELTRLRQFFGDNLTPDAAQSLGIPQSVVQQMVQTELLNIAAGDAGLLVDDRTVAETIQGMEQFAGLTGEFDRQRFAEVLFQGGFTEASFVELVRREVERNALVSGLTGTPPVADSLVKRLYRYGRETRDADMLVIPDAALAEPETPDETTIATFYEENTDAFMAPPYRKVAYVSMTPETVADEVAVGEDEIVEAYEARAAAYATAARRNLSQMIFADRETAETAVQQLAEGGDFTAVAGDLAGQSPDAVLLGWTERDDLLPSLVDPVFAAATGEIVGPVESPIGWHVFRVNQAEDQTVSPLEEVRDEIVAELIRERALDRLFDLANRFDELIGSGASLENAAGELNLPVQTLTAIDRSGRDMAGSVVEGLPDAGFVNNVFAEEIGIESPLIETDEGYYALRVDDETEPRLRALDEVRDDIVAELQRRDRIEQARVLAEGIVGRVNGGVKLADAASEAMPGIGVDIVPLSGLERSGGTLPEGTPRTILEPLFDVAEGNAGMAATGESFAVVHATGISVPEPSSNAAAVAELEGNIAVQVEQDLRGQLVGGLGQRIGVEVNAAAIEQNIY